MEDETTTRRTVGIIAAGSAIVGALALRRLCSARPYHGPPSDHFDGRRFHNLDPGPTRAPGELRRWLRERQPGPWRPVDPQPAGEPPPRRLEGERLRVTFVNHATVLLQTCGLNALTDPIWSERASPVGFAGPRRVRPPGLRFEDLPPIDLVLVSHDHYDHLDLPTLARLAAAHRPRIFVGLGVGALLARAGIGGAVELDWWQEVEVAPGMRVTCVPMRHFSGRSLCDSRRTLWCGWALRGPAGTALFAGDTGYGPHFEEIARRLGPVRLAVLPVGAYEPRWFMRPVHMSPEDALRAARDLGAGTAVGIHHGTFRLSEEGQDEPGRAVAAALEREGGPPFWMLGFGEGREVPAGGERTRQVGADSAEPG